MNHDLCQVGLHLAAVHVPLSMLGAALPAAAALAMFLSFANINRSPANSQKASLSRFVQYVPSICAVPLSVLGMTG